MIIIYDFDGTLTPHGLPQYAILKELGYDDEKLLIKVKEEMKQSNISLYEAFYKTYEIILRENGKELTHENIVYKAQDVELNNGVISFFESMKDMKNLQNYIVTSGFEEYVKNTKISPYLDGIYGVTYKKEEGKHKEIDRLITDEEKPTIIKEIISQNKGMPVIYIGDGLTDKYAFEYVHSTGGTTIYVGSTNEDFSNYETLHELGIVDEYFTRDYDKESDLSKYINKLLKGRAK